MPENKYVIPDGMWNAARLAMTGGVYLEVNSQAEDTLRKVLHAAIWWLVENPIVPDEKQVEDMRHGYEMQASFGVTPIWAYAPIEWQRRMFLAPEPKMHPKLEMLINECQEAGWEKQHIETLRYVFNDAYQRGKEGR
jgi:hypothetical protein